MKTKSRYQNGVLPIFASPMNEKIFRLAFSYQGVAFYITVAAIISYLIGT